MHYDDPEYEIEKRDDEISELNALLGRVFYVWAGVLRSRVRCDFDIPSASCQCAGCEASRALTSLLTTGGAGE